MSRSIIGLILIWLFSLPLKASQPIFNISSLDATHGQIIDVDFHVDHFANIISVQYSVNWDPAVLKFKSIKNFNPNVPGLSASVFGTPANLVDAGKFTLTWFESSVTPITIPDGSLFYTVEFEVLGNPCDASPVAITADPLEIEVSEPNEVLVGLVSNDGTVNVPGTGCSQGIEIIGNTVNGPCGGNVCVQFTVQNFNDVGVIEFSMVFNSAVLQFDKVQNFAPLLGFGSGNVNLAAPDSLKVVWFNGNVENQSLPNGTVLFEICFNVIGGGGQSSDITFGNSPITFSDVSDNQYAVNITPASVTAQCALQGFALIADTLCAQPNDIVCMDIKVNDFDNIVAFQFSMNWDSTKFRFDHVEGFGIPGLGADGFGVPYNADVKQGQLLVSWLDLSLQGVSVADYTTIFRLCLKAVGPVGSSSPITFTAIPLPIEIVNTADSVLVYTLVQGLGQIKAECGNPCTVSYVLTPTNPTCPGTSTGSLNLNVTTTGDCQCTPTYLWSYQGATTEDLTNVPAGNYSVTITCNQVIIATTTITDPPQMAVTSVITNPVPAGSCNGSINITVSGGTPDFAYTWSTTPPQHTEDLNNLCAGSYTVTITDNNGCVFVPDPFIVGADISAVVLNATCNGTCNGSINLGEPSFGTAPYTYLWNTTPPQTTQDLSNLCAGTYCVTITDSGGSSRDTCFNVTQDPPIVLTATVTPDANMNCGGAIDLNVIGGTLPYSYSWKPGNASTQDLIGLCSGQYCVTVTDGHGCLASNCFNVFAGGSFNVGLTAQQHNGYQISCSGLCDGVITSTLSGGTPPITYHWSNNQTSPNLSNVCAGTYGLTVTDAGGQTATASIVINAPDPLNLNVTTTDPSSPGASDGAASVVVTGGVPIPNYTYLWTGPVSGNTAALNNIPAGSYTLLVTDGNGCQETKVVTVGVDPINCHKGMSVITPNLDGKNDEFIINCVNEPNHLYIFNRQGGLIYETDNYQNDWIGVDNDNQPVPDGGYLWVLEEYGPTGTTQLYKGTVVLLRTAD
jgi:gliding motility-associated-like protein